MDTMTGRMRVESVLRGETPDTVPVALHNLERDQTQSINMKGTFLTVKYCIRHIREAGGGSVNVVCPGATDRKIVENTFPRNLDKITIPREFPDGMIPLGRSAKPEEVAGTIVFLATDEATYVTGTEMYVDGAVSLIQG